MAPASIPEQVCQRLTCEGCQLALVIPLARLDKGDKRKILSRKYDPDVALARFLFSAGRLIEDVVARKCFEQKKPHLICLI